MRQLLRYNLFGSAIVLKVTNACKQMAESAIPQEITLKNPRSLTPDFIFLLSNEIYKSYQHDIFCVNIAYITENHETKNFDFQQQLPI